MGGGVSGRANFQLHPFLSTGVRSFSFIAQNAPCWSFKSSYNRDVKSHVFRGCLSHIHSPVSAADGQRFQVTFNRLRRSPARLVLICIRPAPCLTLRCCRRSRRQAGYTQRCFGVQPFHSGIRREQGLGTVAARYITVPASGMGRGVMS